MELRVWTSEKEKFSWRCLADGTETRQVVRRRMKPYEDRLSRAATVSLLKLADSLTIFPSFYVPPFYPISSLRFIHWYIDKQVSLGSVWTDSPVACQTVSVWSVFVIHMFSWQLISDRQIYVYFDYYHVPPDKASCILRGTCISGWQPLI